MRRISHRRLAVSFVIVAFTLCVLTPLALLGVQRAAAQCVAVWPGVAAIPPPAGCMPAPNMCIMCTLPGAVLGCTATIPAMWNQGVIVQMPPGNGCNCSTFNCGPQYMCLNGLPNGINCPFPLICQ